MSTERIEAQLRNISKIVKLFQDGRIPIDALELVPAQAESARLDLQRLRGAYPATLIDQARAFCRGLIERGCKP